MKRLLQVALAGCLATLPVSAETQVEVREEPMVKATRADVSPPLRDMAKNYEFKANGKSETYEVPNVFMEGIPGAKAAGPGEAEFAFPAQRTERPDPNASLTPQPIVNFEALNNVDNEQQTGFIVVPPDPVGDVGRDYYVEWVNIVLAVYEKDTGNRVLGPIPGNALWAGFGGRCETENSGDPIVLFDHLADRWVLTQFEPLGGAGGLQCFAVSTTSDPTGSYYRYEFEFTADGINDYPKVSIWPDGYYISSRDIALSLDLFNWGLGVVERDAMLVGDPNARLKKFTVSSSILNLRFGAVIPAHLEGPAPAPGTPNSMVLYWDTQENVGGPSDDGYRIFELGADWANNEFTFSERPLALSSGFDSDVCDPFLIPDNVCAEQPSPGSDLPTLDLMTMYRVQYRDFGSHESMMVTHVVDAGGDQSGVRWSELRRIGGEWAVHQEGTYAPGGVSRIAPALAMDASGNVSVAYTATSTTVFPSVRYTTRTPSDELGTLPGGEVELVAGSGVQTEGGDARRWGDYTSMSVDPDDDCTFWYVGEYMEVTGERNWTSRIGSWRMPNCGEFLPSFSLDAITGQAGGDVTWSVSGATAGGEVRVYCDILASGNNFQVGIGSANGGGSFSSTRPIPETADGATIQCRGLDTTTYSVTAPVNKTL